MEPAARLTAEAAYTVQLFDTDASGVLSPRGLWDFLQETAGYHTQLLGVAPEDLRPRGLAWILARLRMQVQRYPALGEKVTVRTWPCGIEKLFALRDFTVCDTNGEQIACATSAWLALKLDTLRPVRVQSVFSPPGMEAFPRALETGIERLPAPSNVSREWSTAVRFVDLDANRHVGNSRYVEWVVESAGRELLEGSMMSELGIDFLSETPYGGGVMVRTGQEAGDPPRLSHSIVRTTDWLEAARARTAWRPQCKD
jgi:acyl-ACP thioesterase